MIWRILLCLIALAVLQGCGDDEAPSQDAGEEGQATPAAEAKAEATPERSLGRLRVQGARCPLDEQSTSELFGEPMAVEPDPGGARCMFRSVSTDPVEKQIYLDWSARESPEQVQQVIAEAREEMEAQAQDGLEVTDQSELGEGAFAAVYDGATRHGTILYMPHADRWLMFSLNFGPGEGEQAEAVGTALAQALATS